MSVEVVSLTAVLVVVVLGMVIHTLWSNNRELRSENKELRRNVAILSKHPTGVNLLIQKALDQTLDSIGSLVGIQVEPPPYARRRADDED
ncbi:hypothetical protein [Mycobacteroides abscessus]|uniref:hypothetical protein n=1 Tax=Mycobacteroides abscessus TaxID=36809 RepID=UPI0002686785|nr:hypothetical protein [Mycobacteroides abscessus]EIV68288.1 hypothetical protein MMCCUG48898_1634 [Mycobacteroides abscessus subsp. massiliense CCUG 48898 = JCM 15300]ORA92145.1 hypothetical protein BST32_01885 [Mycobacteroides abscessus subsp. massiliense]WJJ56361.1 membrane protein [Mycobacterium phage CCUG48898T-2]